MPSEPTAAEDAVVLATLFHETYERLAPLYGYETRTETRRFDAESPNGKLMVATCAVILESRDRAAAAELAELRADRKRLTKGIHDAINAAEKYGDAYSRGTDERRPFLLILTASLSPKPADAAETPKQT